jgi:DNA-binding MarR family transcriptional regulator
MVESFANLTKKELVKRQEHTMDTIVKTVLLTESGIKIIKKAVVTVSFLTNSFSVITEKTTCFKANFLMLLGNKSIKTAN